MNKLSLSPLSCSRPLPLSLVGCAAPYGRRRHRGRRPEARSSSAARPIRRTRPSSPSSGTSRTRTARTVSRRVPAPSSVEDDLTAGHCVKPSDDTDSTRTTRSRSARTSAGERRHRRRRGDPHPSYDPSVFGNNDVGIIVLETATTVKPPHRAGHHQHDRQDGHARRLRQTDRQQDEESHRNRRSTCRSIADRACSRPATAGGICSGDSGGPMLSVNGQTEETSSWASHSCVDNVKTCLGRAAACRTDTVKDFVLAHISDAISN